MTRLSAAHRAVERLRTSPAGALYRAELDAITLALGRMAQLEKVAELARTSVRGPDPQVAEHATLLLDLAITDLDNHPDSREPQVVAEVRPNDRPAREAWPSWRDRRGLSVTEDE